MSTASGNQQQSEYWNGPVGEHWAREHVELDRSLGVFGRAARERLAIVPGESVLDVGCGAGATVLELLDGVGDTGRVVGIDLSRPQLTRARERTHGRPNVALLEADASTCTFESPFDAIYSRYGVMFFADPVAAFGNLRRALAHTGRIGFVCWQALADNPWCALPLGAVRPLLSQPPPAPDPTAPGPFAFADPARVRHILSSAGFSRPELLPFRAPMLMSEHGVEAAVDFALRVGPAARLVAEQSDAVRERARDALRQTLGAFQSGARVALDGLAWLVTARA